MNWHGALVAFLVTLTCALVVTLAVLGRNTKSKVFFMVFGAYMLALTTLTATMVGSALQ